MSFLPPHLRREMALAVDQQNATSVAKPLTDLQHERRLIFRIAAIIGAVCVFALLTAS